ncbi:MAG: hypothetical protein ABIC95_01600, partial [archaeon]
MIPLSSVAIHARVKELSHRKRKLAHDVEHITHMRDHGAIDFSTYEHLIEEKLDGKTLNAATAAIDRDIDRMRWVLDNRQRVMTVSMVLFLLVGVSFLLSPTFLGFVLYDELSVETDTVGISFSENGTFPFLPSVGLLHRGLQMSGRIEGDGPVRIWADIEGMRQLVYQRLPVSSPLITGMVAGGAGWAMVDNNSINGTPDLPPDNATASPPDEVSPETPPETAPAEEDTITVTLAYGDNPRWDPDDDGVEDMRGVVDLSIDGSAFSWTVAEETLCTVWTVTNSEDDSTSRCFGDSDCCAFSGMAPTSARVWGDTYTLYHGYDGADSANTVTARIVSYDVDLDAGISRIVVSDQASLPVRFESSFVYFNDICRETCLTVFGATAIPIIVEADNATVHIDNLTYSVIEVAQDEEPEVMVEEEPIVIPDAIQGAVVVGQPVAWTRRVRINVSNGSDSVDVHPNAFNVTVDRIEAGRKVRMAADRFTVNDGGAQQPRGIMAMITGQTARQPLQPKHVVIGEPAEEVEVVYFTEAPQKEEVNLAPGKKRITVSSETHYTNILAETDIPDAPADAIALFWLVNGSREQVADVTKLDVDGDGLIDRIQWIIPHLSNQTYEVEITVLNVQSYPTVGGTWTVAFNTTGQANLTISAVDGTTYGGGSPDDLEPLQLLCGDEDVIFNCEGNNCSSANWSCNLT